MTTEETIKRLLEKVQDTETQTHTIILLFLNKLFFKLRVVFSNSYLSKYSTHLLTDKLVSFICTKHEPFPDEGHLF